MTSGEIERPRSTGGYRGKGSNRSRSPRLLGVLGVLALVVLVAACGGAGTAAPEPSAPAGSTGKGGNVDISELPEATTYTTLENAPLDPHPHGETSGEVIHPKKELVVYDAVNGTPIAVLPVEQINSPTWVPVIARKGDWAHILLPTRPNGSSGWVKATERTVESARTNYSAEVDLSDFTLTVFHKGERIHRYTIGIGSRKHPTPTGRAYIIASVLEQKNDYSDVILPLSVHSDSLTTYGGGPGTVGIHTWPNNSFLGERNSDGCIRVTPPALKQLKKLPLGTIIDIVDISIPENTSLIHAGVGEVKVKEGYAAVKDLHVRLGTKSTYLDITGISAICQAGDLSSSVVTIKYGFLDVLPKVQGIEGSFTLSPKANTSVPSPLDGLIDITFNKQVTPDNGPNTVTTLSVTLLKALDPYVPDTLPLSGLFGQKITLASATCAKTNDGGDDTPSNGGNDNPGDNGRDKPGDNNDGNDGDNNGNQNGDGGDGDGQVADEAEEDGTAPIPVPQPGHISVTG